jgi:DNA-directed RNA polymerase specialized sigma24 family protein
VKAKDYLLQLEKLDTIITNKLIEKDQWKATALSVTSRTDGERVQSTSRPSKMADAIDKCVVMEAEIDSLVDRLIDLKREVTSVIEQLNATEYDVLHKRYIQYMSYIDIASAKGRDYNWVTTVHGRALKNVQRILDLSKEQN